MVLKSMPDDKPWQNSETDPPSDLEVVEGWDYDLGHPVFVQWLAGPKKFVDACVVWQDTVTVWRPIA